MLPILYRHTGSFEEAADQTELDARRASIRGILRVLVEQMLP